MKRKDHAAPTSDPPLPLANSYWVIPNRLLAGEHPGNADETLTRARLERLLRAGIDSYVDLTEPGEAPEYRHLLPQGSEYLRSAIADTCVPNNISQTRGIIIGIRQALERDKSIYVHCRAGIGRTGLLIGCLLAEEDDNGRAAVKRLNRMWQQSARAKAWPRVPQTAEQTDYILHWPKLRKLGVTSDD